MLKATPERIKVILAELETTSNEYTVAIRNLQRARGQFEAAREKFTGIRRLASEMLTSYDWYRWREAHPGVRYAGMSIGEAILEALEEVAYTSAFNHVVHQREFSPDMTMDTLVPMLESGGFEFQTATPLRELNAALINLKGVEKSGIDLRASNADEILKTTIEDHTKIEEEE